MEYTEKEKQLAYQRACAVFSISQLTIDADDPEYCKKAINKKKYEAVSSYI